jgi:hypothetical protein
MEQECRLLCFVISAFNFPSHRHVGPSNGKCSIISVRYNGSLRSNKRRNAVLIDLRCEQWKKCKPECDGNERRELQYTKVLNALLAVMFIYSTYNSTVGTATAILQILKSTSQWDVMLCSLVKIHGRFGGEHCLHF